MSNAISYIFPPIEIGDTEMDIIIAALATPSLQKYLRSLATNSATDLLAISLADKSDTNIVKIHARIQGRLEVVSTLLSIVATPNPSSKE